MCGDICPAGAIEYVCDKQGFWYPKVDTKKCTQCGVCVRKCPVLHYDPPQDGRVMPAVYSAWSKNEEVRLESTSGGVFWEIARIFLADGGVVAGSRYGADLKSAEHIIAHTEKELLQLRGSKYFQSDTAGIYHQIRQELDAGKKVLFCGTPCQNAALRAYIGKENDTLYLMDFICRCINSPKAFASYISEWENVMGAKAVKVRLKDKTRGWPSIATHITFENGKEILYDKNEDTWVRGFLNYDFFTRPSCYTCQYRTVPRTTADITIGDFWGIKHQMREDLFKGISVVLVNTEKGKELLARSLDRFVLCRRRIEDVIPGNPALLNPPPQTKISERFFDLLETYPFSVCVEKCIKADWHRYVRGKMASLKIKGKKALRFLLNTQISKTKFIYYNFFCPQIIRDKKAKVIPYRGAVIDLRPGAKLYLKGQNLAIGCSRLPGSKAETYLRMGKNSIWNCQNGASLSFGTFLDIKENAVMETGFFFTNIGCVIVAAKRIVFGEGVLMGRNIIIYDSDFHAILAPNGEVSNTPEPVVIEDHVWLTGDIRVLKGVTVGKGSLICGMTVVSKDVPPRSMVAGKSNGTVIRNDISWSWDDYTKGTN